MFAAGELLLGAAPALTVPDDAIVERDGYRYVFVVGDGDVVAQRRVETGLRRGGLVEIRDGVGPSDRVVVTGAAFLAEGDRVRVVASADAAADADADAGSRSSDGASADADADADAG